MGKSTAEVAKRNEQIVAAVKAGEKTTVVAVKFGVDASQVSRIWRLRHLIFTIKICFNAFNIS